MVFIASVCWFVGMLVGCFLCVDFIAGGFGVYGVCFTVTINSVVQFMYWLPLCDYVC